ncbi:peptidoglycan D,D-transpeptidase FtsI family protein [Kineosporia babensis]|uniref:Penicillin-binding protein 2 n=1 Tax=Kineosporia babensis TaxID=499548 RepID=A0A9X1NBJ6_9ACTN|nr:penicillin-binding protein 2 [Kineosporia babensis]MCD5311108.1 penicillin-binding protein 2 [Kineosporia babensis]
MNGPIRHLAAVITLLFSALFVAVTYIQVIARADLEDHPRNLRTQVKERSRERGQILAGSTVVARSEPAEGTYPFLRSYPLGPMYAPVTGYFGVNLQPFGLEGLQSEYLSGTHDSLFLPSLGSLLTGEQAKGATIETTINPEAQKAAWDELEDQRGAVIALDPRTGAILAMVSRPSYNPNRLAVHDTGAAYEAYQKLNADQLQPLLNRALRQTYPPGSTFKIVTAAAALADGWQARSRENVNGSKSLRLPGTNHRVRNSGGHGCFGGRPTLLQAFAASCNTTFAQLAMELGNDKMRDQAEKFGFGLELSVPQTVTPSVFADGDLDQSQLALSGLGQLNVRTTPLQVAMLAAAVANDGVLMRPNLIRRVVSANGKTVSEPGPEELSTAVSPDVADQLADMMKAAVQSPQGTGSAARIPGVEVAGKTGTAQTGTTDDTAPHTWFTSFAPVDDPQVAVAVVVENGGLAGNEGYGGTVAAPIADAVTRAVLKR